MEDDEVTVHGEDWVERVFNFQDTENRKYTTFCLVNSILLNNGENYFFTVRGVDKKFMGLHHGAILARGISRSY